MRFISASISAALLASHVLGHPASSSTSRGGLQARAIDLSAFRLKPVSTYSNASVTNEADFNTLVRRADYLETASALVQKLAPGAQFRVVDDHYVGDNGIAHVNLKQTVNGLDIDNADFNVNVSCL